MFLNHRSAGRDESRSGRVHYRPAPAASPTAPEALVPVDPQIQELLDHLAQGGAPRLEELSVADARSRATLASVMESVLEARRRTGRQLAPATDSDAGVQAVEEHAVPTVVGLVQVRIYRPRGGAEPRPLLQWMHGGGFVLGSLDSSDAMARALCAGAGMIVASVDYPLAPEHPFPAAPEACHDVAVWLGRHAGELGADRMRFAVGGDSAGGNLAAVTALLAHERGGPSLCFQLLVYPIIDMFSAFPSMRENGEGYFLTAAGMEWFKGHYLPEGVDRRNPLASPIYAKDLSSQPRALVVTAELDPLRDEGEAYGERLREAGVEATTRRHDGLIHGFLGMAAVSDRAREAFQETVTALRQALA